MVGEQKSGKKHCLADWASRQNNWHIIIFQQNWLEIWMITISWEKLADNWLILSPLISNNSLKCLYMTKIPKIFMAVSENGQISMGFAILLILFNPIVNPVQHS